MISLRITDQESINNIKRSYQQINFSGAEDNPEIANYVVFNFKDALNMFRALNPSGGLIGAYGYWGRPSQTAVTIFDKLIFSVFYVQKKSADKAKSRDIKGEFNLPLQAFI